MKKVRKWNRTVFTWRFGESAMEGLRTKIGGPCVLLHSMIAHSTRERTCKINVCFRDGGRPFTDHERSLQIHDTLAHYSPNSYFDPDDDHPLCSTVSRVIPLNKSEQFCDGALRIALAVLEAFQVETPLYFSMQFELRQDTWVEVEKDSWISLKDYLKLKFLAIA